MLVGWGMATAVYPGNRRAAGGPALVRRPGAGAGGHTGSYDLHPCASACRSSEAFSDETARGLELGGEQQAIVQVDDEGEARRARGVRSGLALAGLSADQMVLAGGRAASAGEPSKGSRLHRAAVADALGRGQGRSRTTRRPRQYSIRGARSSAESDPALPRVKVTRWVSAIDFCRVLNARLSRSQIVGGVTVGIGMALMEHTVYDLDRAIRSPTTSPTT